MGLPTDAIEVATIARLRGDTSLQALIGSAAPLWNIFDFNGVPINQAFPFIAAAPIANQVGSAMTLEMNAVDTWIQISIYTQTGATGGFKQARGIASRIYDLFHRQALDLSASGFSNFFCLFENAPEEPQPDGITQHIPMRFKLMTQG